MLMHAIRKPGSKAHSSGSALIQSFFRLAGPIGLTLVLSCQGLAQYPGGGGTGMGTGSTGPGYTPPRDGYGSGKAIGIGAGAAAGVGVLFLALHHAGAVTGCVRPTSDGLRLVDEKKNKTYLIAPDSIALKPGEVVQLKGKKSTDHDGISSFQAKKVVKSLGTCTVDSGLSPIQSSPQ